MTKKIKILSIFACAMAFFMLFPIGASATQKQSYKEIPIYIEGKRVEGSEALLIDSITYVPLRKLVENSKDCKITYNHATRTATVKFEDLTITVTTGKKYISVNGRYFWGVGEVKNINGSLYVPIRPLARALELDVKWNASNYSVNLTKATWTLVDAENYYDPQELYWLSRIIEAEAGGEIIEGKIAVGNVVLNRVKDSRYPNTI